MPKVSEVGNRHAWTPFPDNINLHVQQYARINLHTLRCKAKPLVWSCVLGQSKTLLTLDDSCRLQPGGGSRIWIRCQNLIEPHECGRKLCLPGVLLYRFYPALPRKPSSTTTLSRHHCAVMPPILYEGALRRNPQQFSCDGGQPWFRQCTGTSLPEIILRNCFCGQIVDSGAAADTHIPTDHR